MSASHDLNCEINEHSDFEFNQSVCAYIMASQPVTTMLWFAKHEENWPVLKAA